MFRNSAFRVVFFFAVFGITWTILSELLVFSRPNILAEAYDQLVLVVVSLAVIYFLVRRELEEHNRLQGELNKLARVVQQTADHVLITDRNGIIEYVNPAFEQLTGYSATEVIGKTPRLLKSGKHDSGFYDKMWNTILSGKVFTAEIINRKKDGTFYHEEKSITPIRNDQGEIINFVSTAKDISERKQAEESLVRADRMKTEFMQMISHEFRTPLTAIRGFAQLLEGESYGAISPAQKDFIARISSQASHLEDLIISILDYSRLEYGKKFEVSREPVSVASIINDVVEAMRPEFEKKEIKVNLDLPATLPTIISDEAKIERILTNLLGNAFKFTARRGVITISADSGDDHITIKVSDTGIGIAPENLTRIFDRFYQVDSSITRGYGGIGMGLTIAKELVEALGGLIRAESGGEGKGATFSFTLQLS